MKLLQPSLTSSLEISAILCSFSFSLQSTHKVWAILNWLQFPPVSWTTVESQKTEIKKTPVDNFPLAFTGISHE